MSIEGRPDNTVVGFDGDEVFIIAASWHEKIMDALIEGAVRTCRAAGVEPRIIRVPGTFELPVAAQVAAENDADVIIALGVVIRGGTPHFEYVCSAATQGLTTVALENNVPIGFGVLTCDNEEQALDRCGLPGSSEDKGAEAAAAALNMWAILEDLEG